MTIGARIKAARKNTGLTQAKLSEISGVAAITIHQYEAGKRHPQLAQIQGLSKALNVPMSYLMGDTDDPNDRSKTHWMEIVKGDDPDPQPKQIVFNVTPDPEWEDLHRKLENGTITLEEKQRLLQMMDEGLERARKTVSEKKVRILTHMDKLNEEGQQKAVERVEELAEIPRYQRQGTNPTPTENGTEAPETGKK